MSTREPSWLVVGGGIGGLSTALALARTGVRVQVLERAREFTEIGAGLQIGANATRAMSSLGVLAQAEDVAVHPDRALMLDALDGSELTALTLGAPYRERYGFPYLVMHRSDLLEILLAACLAHDLVTLHAGVQVTTAATGEDGATVTCADGTSYEADVVVGADGLRSSVRRLIDTSEPTSSGYVGYRGTMPMDTMPMDTAPMGTGLTNTAAFKPDDVLFWIGPELHLVQYPVRRGELYNQVAVFRSRDWESGASDWGTPEELDARFAITCAPVRAAVSQITRDRRYPTFERDPLPTWRQGRVVLLGDAAHPMLQYLGQGACQAMEDALCLAEQAQVMGPQAPEKALSSYEEIRLPRASRCQLTARPWGQVWHTTDPVTVALRNRYMRLRSPDDYTDVDWLYLDQTA